MLPIHADSNILAKTKELNHKKVGTLLAHTRSCTLRQEYIALNTLHEHTLDSFRIQIKNYNVAIDSTPSLQCKYS